MSNTEPFKKWMRCVLARVQHLKLILDFSGSKKYIYNERNVFYWEKSQYRTFSHFPHIHNLP